MIIDKGKLIDWDSAVSSEAGCLIERGVPPYVAVEQAVKNVSAKRREGKGNHG